MAGGSNTNTDLFPTTWQDSGLMNESRSGCEMSRVQFTGVTFHSYIQH